MAGLNTAQIKDRARAKGISLSEAQAQSILSQAWDQSQYGADSGRVNDLLSGMTGGSGGRETNGGGGGLGNQVNRQLVDQISQVISDLEEQLNNLPGVALTDEEIQSFLSKAIDQISPYYDRKKGEIDKGIKEGKIRTAEDLLAKIREVYDEARGSLKKLDIREASTREELVDTLASITTKKEEDLAFNKKDWEQRISQTKDIQVQQGVLTSGIGKKYIQDLLGRQGMEEAAIQRRAGEQTRDVMRQSRYTLEDIAASREMVEKMMGRQLGTPDEAAETIKKLRETLGLPEPDQADMLRRVGPMPVLPIGPGGQPIEVEPSRTIQPIGQPTMQDTTGQPSRIQPIGQPSRIQPMPSSIQPYGDVGALLGARDMAGQFEMLRQRMERGITPRSPEDLSSLEEERRRAVESRRQELQEQEMTIRREEEARRRQQIMSRIANEQRRLQNAYNFY